MIIYSKIFLFLLVAGASLGLILSLYFMFCFMRIDPKLRHKKFFVMISDEWISSQKDESLKTMLLRGRDSYKLLIKYLKWYFGISLLLCVALYAAIGLS
jgi:hypothetical protein